MIKHLPYFPFVVAAVWIVMAGFAISDMVLFSATIAPRPAIQRAVPDTAPAPGTATASWSAAPVHGRAKTAQREM